MTGIICKTHPIILLIMVIFVWCVSAVDERHRLSVPNGESLNLRFAVETDDGFEADAENVEAAQSNSFYQDLRAEGFKWTETLCRKDSDNDGITNGEELGDPDCLWKPGQVPRTTSNISNPGICEPKNSTRCKNMHDGVFQHAKQSCPEIANSDVQRLDLRLRPSKVPATRTNLMCQAFNVLGDRPYHLIAFDGILEGSGVAHHILIRGCFGENKPKEMFECEMEDMSCPEILAAYRPGLDGFCMPREVGTNIGKGTYSYLMLEVHWHNPMEQDDLFDASGLALFYTPLLRSYEAGILTTGQMSMKIPPMKEKHTVYGICSSDCTRGMMPHPINITVLNLHMHYLGIGGSVKQYRNGTLVRTLYTSDNYDPMAPTLAIQNPQVQVLPGDSLVTECVYQTNTGSRQRNTTVRYGFGTLDEMCFTYLSYYPRLPDFRTCYQIGQLDNCFEASKINLGDCNKNKLEKISERFVKSPELLHPYKTPNGYNCPDTCLEVIKPIMQLPCLQGPMGEHVRYAFFKLRVPELPPIFLACEEALTESREPFNVA